MINNNNDDNKMKKLSAAQYNYMPPADKCQNLPSWTQIIFFQVIPPSS